MTQTLNKILLLLGVLAIACLPVFHVLQTPAFHEVFAIEDGPVEWITAICLFCSFLILARYSFGFARAGRRTATIALALYAFLFFFAAGEEISWGQRIFGWEAGEFFTSNSHRAETNLHNLKIGDIKLVKVLFGNILTPILLMYLVVLPLLYPRVGWARRLADKLVIPVPHLSHTVLALAGSLIIPFVDLQRKWEVYEMLFGVLALSIFLLPQNRDKFPFAALPKIIAGDTPAEKA